MDKLNKIIVLLIALKESIKAVHYSVKGESAYAKHLLADRIYENIDEQIDTIKEALFLSSNEKLLSVKDYLNIAADLSINLSDDDKNNFIFIQHLIIDTLQEIENLKHNQNFTAGELTVMDDIAKTLLTKLALINMQVK